MSSVKNEVAWDKWFNFFIQKTVTGGCANISLCSLFVVRGHKVCCWSSVWQLHVSYPHSVFKRLRSQCSIGFILTLSRMNEKSVCVSSGVGHVRCVLFQPPRPEAYSHRLRLRRTSLQKGLSSVGIRWGEHSLLFLHFPTRLQNPNPLKFINHENIEMTMNEICRCAMMTRWSGWWPSPWSWRRSSESLTWTRRGRCSPPTESPKTPPPNWRLVVTPLRRSDVLL